MERTRTPKYFMPDSGGAIGYCTSSHAVFSEVRNESPMLLKSVGSGHPGMHRGLNTKAHFAVGWYGCLLMKPWLFSVRAKKSIKAKLAFEKIPLKQETYTENKSCC